MARRDRRRDADGLRLGPTCEQKGLAVCMGDRDTVVL
ncbi:hypothetical protein PF006_g19826, partial [Phytophthora fragariae]